MYACHDDDLMMISTDGRMNSNFELQSERERKPEREFDKRERAHVRTRKRERWHMVK
jgi:hypothetical protein